MDIILLLPFVLSFVTALILMPYWIKKAKQIGLIWEDMNKFKRPKNVAGSGGIIVLMAFVVGVLSYVAIKTFIFRTEMQTLEIFVLLTTLIIAAMIGFVDDIFGWTRGGLSARIRIVLVLISSIPMIVINAGSSSIDFPFFGVVNLGLIYPLVMIPIGMIATTTTFNFLAGFNGLEAGQGIIVITTLSIVAYLTGSSWLTVIGFCMVAGLIVFYLFNCNPAKVFAGDVMTYSIGSLIGCMAILGNFEKIAIIIFIPYILEVILKLRGKLKKQSFGIPQKDGSLELPYDKIYGLEHLAIYVLKKVKPSKKVYENDVVWLINGFQLIIVCLTFFIFRGSLFS